MAFSLPIIDSYLLVRRMARRVKKSCVAFAFLTAEKIDQNVGVEKKWVCHDYGLSQPARAALKSGRSLRSFHIPAVSFNTAAR
jgi:hypothetical protein